MNRTISFLLAFAVQFVSYVVLTVNIRAIASERYLLAGLTAIAASVLFYAIVQRVTKDETHATLAGLIVGGGLGDVIGIYLTRWWS